MYNYPHFSDEEKARVLCGGVKVFHLPRDRCKIRALRAKNVLLKAMQSKLIP